MKKFLTSLFSALFLCILCVCAEASTAGSVNEAAYKEWLNANYGDFIKSPVNLNESALNISGTTQSASLTETDLSLPGKNGMDVNIIRRYDSNVTCFSYWGDRLDNNAKLIRTCYKSETGKTHYVDFRSEEEFFEADTGDGININMDMNPTLYALIKDDYGTHVTRDTTYEPNWTSCAYRSDDRYFIDNMYNGVDLTKGWQLPLPTLVAMYTVAGSFSSQTYFQVLRFPDGTCHTVQHKYQSKNKILTSYEGKFTDSADFEILYPYDGAYDGNIEDTEKGIRFCFKFRYKNGHIYYFDLNGYLVYEEDRFGNHIKYVYSAEGIEITDTMGRIIRYVEENSGERLGKITVTADGVTRDMVYYDLHAEIPEDQGIFTYNNTYTLSVTKPENGESAAECKNKTLYEMKYRTFARPTTNTSYGFIFPTVIINKITKPDGSFSEYNFERTGTLNNTVFKESKYRVESSNDCSPGDSTVLNSWTYSYSDGFTKTRADGFKQIAYYDSAKRLGSLYTEGDGIKTHEWFVYDKNRIMESNPSPKVRQTVKQIFNPVSESNYDYYEIITNLNFDERENKISENVMGRVSTYDYGTAETNPYNFVLSEIRENNGVQTKTENTLTQDMTNISDTKTYAFENDGWVLKNHASYEYDSFGNLTKEIKRPAENKTIETNFVYTYSGSAYNVETYKLNADGARVSTFSYFDSFGTPERDIDARGFETSYTYDYLSRLLSKRTADGGECTYSYDTENNTVYAANEIGTEVKQEFDLYGREKATYVKNAEGNYVLLQSKTYFPQSGLLSSLKETGAGGTEVLTEYTYDGADRVKTKTVKEKTASGAYAEKERITNTYEFLPDTGVSVVPKEYKTVTAEGRYTAMPGEKYTRNLSTKHKATKTYLFPENTYIALADFQTQYSGAITVTLTKGTENIPYDFFSHDRYDTTAYYYRGCVINADGASQVTFHTNSNKRPMRIGNFRVYTKDSLNALGTKITTVHSGTGAAAVTAEQRINIWDEKIYEKKTDSQTGSVLTEESYTYDEAGNVLSYRNPVSYDLGTDSVTKTYDYAGRLETETSHDSDFGSAVTATQYDNIGRTTKVTDPKNAFDSYVYDDFDRVIRHIKNAAFDIGACRTDYTYDKNGNVTRETVYKTAAETTVTDYEYDCRNRVTKATSYASGTSYPSITQYYYDKAGNLLRMYTGLSSALDLSNPQSLPSGGYVYEYDFMGHLVKMTDPSGKSETYTNDLLGNVLSKTDRNGDSVITSYNYMSLPVSVTSSKSGTVSYEYDFRGNRTKMTDSTGVTAFSYSPLSELVSETHGNISKSYSYDKNSARTAFTLSKGGTALLSNTYVNTNTGMLKSMQSGTDTVSYNYDLNKNMTSEVINNALTHSVTYNKHNSVKTAENKFGNAVHSSYSYEVLKNGNVCSVSETLAGVSRQRAFDYDGIGRLKKETDGTNEISYTYDASGNRLTFDKTSLSQRSYGYLPGNISWYSTSNNAFAEYTHDNNGNILSKTGNRVTDYTMTYDGFNRLVSAAVEGGSSASYEYNGDGLRTAKTAKGTRTEFIWDGDRLVCEISGESVTVYKYGNRLFGFEKDGVKKYYNFNGHGDVTGITDSAYTLIKSYEYDAFGVEKNPDPADTNPFRYCAEYYDAETGYIYLRARYYDVKDGRFISEDPAKDGLNWYVYCGNNPVNFVDPSGRAVTDLDYQQFGNVSWAINELQRLTNMWINGNASEKSLAASEAQKVRRRGRAVSYAYAMYHTNNPKYPVRGSECANFVSAALYEGGGFAMTEEWHHYGTQNYIIKDKILATPAWSRGEELFKYFDSYQYREGLYTSYITSANDVQYITGVKPGDILGMDDDNNGTVTHVALITRVDSTGIYYTGRTNDRLDQSIADMYFGKQRQIDGTYKTVSDSERFKGKMYIIRLKY